MLKHGPHPPHLVASRPKGTCRVTVALLTAGATGKPPCVGGTAVAGLPYHVGEALALPCGCFTLAALWTLTVLLNGAQNVADTLCEGKRVLL